MTITLAVSERIATVTTDSRPVGGNEYPFTMSLDSEWTGTLYLRVRFADQYYDIPFVSTDSTVMVQFPIGFPEVGIGIYSEALQICTNEARVRLRPSILEQGGSPVEFDSTLYEQWSNEVTELLTDDAWSATSTHPLQNRVLTAWKDTVALDASVVHRTGAETVAGVKTFSSAPEVRMPTASLGMVTSTQGSSNGIYANIIVRDQYGGSDSTLSIFSWGRTSAGYLFNRQAVRSPDKSSSYTLEHRGYPDHHVLMVTPYYPVDESGNPQALPTGALVASGNIAVDPRIVHTTGSESIAGAKTWLNDNAFEGGVSLSRPAAVKRFERSGTQGYWQPLAKARRGSGASTGLLGLFWLLPTNYDLAKFASLILVYQRTLDSTRDRLGITVLCGNGVDVSTLAVARVEDDIVVYAQKRASLHASVMIPIVQTRNYAYQTDIWSDATSMDELAELPSGAEYATLANAFQPKV